MLSCYQKCREILKSKIDILHNMARLLIEKETIISSDVDMLMEGKSVEEVTAAMEERYKREEAEAKAEVERSSMTAAAANAANQSQRPPEGPVAH